MGEKRRGWGGGEVGGVGGVGVRSGQGEGKKRVRKQLVRSGWGVGVGEQQVR